MTKTHFLKEAKAKYASANTVAGAKWVSEMNFIYSPSLTLRVWFDTNLNENKKRGETGYMHRWCEVQTIESHDKELNIIRQAGQILSANTDDEIKVMVDILRKALVTEPKQTIDYIDGITTWENVEYSFTVESACEYIGLEV